MEAEEEEALGGARRAAARRGLRVTTWAVESKANRQSCACKAPGCRENIGQRSLRVRSAANTSNPQWFHPGCVEGGLGAFSEIADATALEPGAQDELRSFCDQPGRKTRAEYVGDMRQAKRVKAGEVDPGPGARHPLLEADSGEGPELPEDSGDGAARSEQLQNMEWWDEVSYEDLQHWVPTLGRVPGDLLHDLGSLRGAVCVELRQAWLSGQLDQLKRAEKLLSYLDRLVLHSPRSSRGGKRKGLSKVVSARLRLAWAGDWGALWRQAGDARDTMPRRAGRQETLKEQVRGIEAFVKDALVSRAVCKVCRVATFAGGLAVHAALAALFPQDVLPSRPAGWGPQGGPGGPLGPVGPGPTAELRERMLEEAAKLLKRWPSRAAPGPNGSRFEHWGSVTYDTQAWEAAAQVIVMFALGECSEPFLRANLGARLFALRKPNGKLRPIACGSVLRRLAARAVCAACREDIQRGCGKLQFAVGRKAGCEHVHKSISARACARSQDVVLKFDCSNAFNSMPRQLVLDAVQARAPALMPVASAWLCLQTDHLYWSDGGKGLQVHASTGVDQGCPLSPGLFAIGLAPSLERIQAELVQLSPECRVFSYLDDIMVVAPGAEAERAMKVVVEELERVGLTVNAGKTEAWTYDPQAPLPPSVERLRKTRCQVLGATAPWLDPDGDFSELSVHSPSDYDAVLQSARAFVAKVVQLRDAGLSSKAAFLLLQSFSQGHVTHLLRANYESSGWPKDFDEVLVQGVGQLVGEALGESQRAQVFLRLADGGLGFSSAEVATEAAFLASWALTLKEVTDCLGVSSWEGFQSACPPIARSIAEAEAKLLRLAGGNIQPVSWVGLLSEPRGKLQGFWSGKLREQLRGQLLLRLSLDDQVDLRSSGGSGAGGFLEQSVLWEDNEPKTMPDQHFLVMLRDRLRLQVCPPGATCQHRAEDGQVCGELLDGRGKHALKCQVGRTRTGRHDGIKDVTAELHSKTSGYVAVKEQRVTAWDRINVRTGLLEEARLDVATRDCATGRKIFVDNMVTCAHSGYEPRQRARAGKDGVAAADGVRGKRLRYPPSGGELVPLVFEAGGRPAEETVAYVRSLGHGLEVAERSQVIRFAWQQYSTVLQSGNAEMILSAVG